ncbi:MAG: sugar phosphate isomerase/epimerase family protein [Limisphaerales bacterium]
MNRRTFIGNAGLGALALGTSSLRAASGKGITFGFSTYGMKTLETERAIEVLGEIGYDSVEINVWSGWDADSAKLSKERRKSIRKALNNNGIKLTGVMEKLHSAGNQQQATMDRIRRAADLGRDLSPKHQPVLQSTLTGKKWEEMKDVYLRQLEAWVKVAEEAKIVLAIKPHRGGALSRPSEAVWLIEKLGKPKWLRMCYDYSHYAFRDMPMAKTIKTALPYTAHIAIKDAVQKDGRIRFVNPGTSGTIDYGNLLRMFYDGGYRGDVCCEVSGMVWNAKGYDPIVSAKQCYKQIAPAFRKARVPRG